MTKPRPKLRKDAAETAWAVVQAAVGEGERPHPPGKGPKNVEAVKRGTKGGKKGGDERAKKLTPERRSEIARIAAAKRWPKKEI